VGAAVVDTLGDHTPPVRAPGGGKRRRPRLAYVSNVAVSAGARRCGIGATLMQQAEQVPGAAACLLPGRRRLFSTLCVQRQPAAWRLRHCSAEHAAGAT
jgi:GNAT superfamily N-acetyltransferase